MKEDKLRRNMKCLFLKQICEPTTTTKCKWLKKLGAFFLNSRCTFGLEINWQCVEDSAEDV